jgi:nucleotidyltransferase/DNA polymerase involved in DNA repair
MVSGNNPQFIEQYYEQSRLHHLSTTGAQARATIRRLHLEARAAGRQVPPFSEGNSRARVIVHIDLDAFFVSVGLRSRSHLRDRPVVLAHGHSAGNSEISSCNYVARTYGIRNGMGMRRARTLCANLEVIPYEFDKYREASEKFYKILASHTLRIEAVSMDEAYLDLTDDDDVRAAAAAASGGEGHAARDSGEPLSGSHGGGSGLLPFSAHEDGAGRRHGHDASGDDMAEQSGGQAPSADQRLARGPHARDTAVSAATLTRPGGGEAETQRPRPGSPNDGASSAAAAPSPSRTRSPQAAAAAVVQKLRRRIKEELNLTASAGIAHNVLLARMCTRRAKPDGIFFLSPDASVEAFLNDLSIHDLPGVGWATARKLQEAGVETVQAMRHRGLEYLRSEYGNRQGEKLYLAACGVDSRPLKRAEPPKSVSVEITWGVRFATKQQVESFVTSLAAEVVKRLQTEGRHCRHLHFKIMEREPDAAQPYKALGHGPCVDHNRSHAFVQPTASVDEIADVCLALCRDIHVNPVDVRGVGIALHKLSGGDDEVGDGGSGQAAGEPAGGGRYAAGPPLTQFFKKSGAGAAGKTVQMAGSGGQDFRQDTKKAPQKAGGGGAATKEKGPIDPSVLAQLPPAIRAEIEAQYGLRPSDRPSESQRGKPKRAQPLEPDTLFRRPAKAAKIVGGGAAAAAAAPPSTAGGASGGVARFLGEATVFPSPSQWSAEVLSELPPDLVAELQKAATTRHPKAADHTVRDRGSVNLQNTREEVERAEANAAPRPSQQSANEDEDDDIISLQPKSQELPEGVFIDPDYLAALPADIRREVKGEAIRKYEEEMRQHGEEQVAEAVAAAPSGIVAVAAATAAATIPRTSPVAGPLAPPTEAPRQTVSSAVSTLIEVGGAHATAGERTLLFATALGGPLRQTISGTATLALCVSRRAVEAIIRDWVLEAVAGATASQVAALQDYLASLLHEKRLDDALVLLRLVRRLVPQSRDQRGWAVGYNALLQRIQEVMQELYSARLDLPPFEDA